MNPIFVIIRAWIDGVLTDATEVSRRLALIGKPDDETRRAIYLKSLRRLLLVTTLFPVLLLVIGTIQDLRWLVAGAGLFWAFCTLLLSIVAIPIGVLLEILLKGPKGSGRRYVNIVLWVFLVELTATLFIAVVPLHNNVVMIPALFVAAALLVVLAVLNKSAEKFKKVVGSKAALLFIFFTLSFFFPQSFMALGNIKEKIDKGIADVMQNPGSLFSKRTASSQPTVHVLECGTEDDNYDQLPLVRVVYLTVPPTNCWTKWQVRPQGARRFWMVADRDIVVQNSYGNGSKSTPFLDKPTIRLVDRGSNKGGLTGFRFKNPGPKPVNITIQLLR